MRDVSTLRFTKGRCEPYWHGYPVDPFPNLTHLSAYELDMALLRDFHVTENQRVQLRWEVFNVTNEAIFTTLVTAQNSGTFGNYTAAADPRIMQFALKYIF